jgi:transmembrane E3 ubiquitin-protein ligase
MSITRIVAPFYVFAISDNFLKEVYPESPTDALLVLKLAAWLALQVALLICQEKYGARFMIPARFLPPKFDYSRPLPPSMIPPGALDLPVPELIEDRSERSRGVVTKQTEPMSTAVVGQCRHKTAETTRNRLKSTTHRNSNNNGGTMVSEEHHRTPSPSSLPAPTLECSICYDDIDIRDRPNYMLAPCNHLFHRDCLSHWMDAKLECPICRMSLPPL